MRWLKKSEKLAVFALGFIDQEHQEYLLLLLIALASDITKALHPNYR